MNFEKFAASMRLQKQISEGQKYLSNYDEPQSPDRITKNTARSNGPTNANEKESSSNIDNSMRPLHKVETHQTLHSEHKENHSHSNSDEVSNNMNAAQERDKIINQDLQNVIKESFDSKARSSVKSVIGDHLINIKPQ